MTLPFRTGSLWMAAYVAAPVPLALIGTRLIQAYDVRGPYLAASPVIAVTVGVWLMGAWFFGQESEEVHDPHAEGHVESLSSELGLPKLRIMSRVTSGHRHYWLEDPLGRIANLASDWQKLKEPAREFAIVYGLARYMHQRNGRPYRNSVQAAVYAAGIFMAGFNLWFILAVHMAWVLGALAEMKWSTVRQTLVIDRRALAISRNLDAAIAFVRKDSRGPFFPQPETRVQNLRAEATRLGIA